MEIGCPVARHMVESGPSSLRLSTTPQRLAHGIATTGEIPLRTDFESVDPGLVRQAGESRSPDEFLDDLSLVLETDRGLVVLVGCGHRGIINHLLHACEVTGRDDIHAVIGGAHLYRASPERVDRTIEELRKLRVQQLVLGHCTGYGAIARLQSAFPDRVHVNVIGFDLEL